jgi:hypothetical protein
MGCVCDKGYKGYDCSYKKCPEGIDPTSTSTAYDEIYSIQCRATSGAFTITAKGQKTHPIPHNASPGLVKYLLEMLPGIGSVDVSTTIDASAISEGEYQPVICGKYEDYVTTTIVFSDYHGSQPPIMLSNNRTVDTRIVRNVSTALAYHTDAPILRMSTSYTLQCDKCTTCSGDVFFKYGDSITPAIDIFNDNIAPLLSNYIAELEDLQNAGYSNLEVNVTTLEGTTSICSTTSDSTIKISLYSDYGNIPLLTLISSSEYSVLNANITLTSNNKGYGNAVECSNQGYCDSRTGKCVCSQQAQSGDLIYKATGSDGEGSAGGKGDCGYLDYREDICAAVATPRCNGHGFCFSNSPHCTCYDGWYGADCGIATCPVGTAWFDEAISPTEAHQLSECSNMGICNRKTGECLCNQGYSGNACQYMDCDRDPDTGVHCSGKGWCMNMNKWASVGGTTYGDESNHRLYPDAWDAFKIYNCMCSARIPEGFTGHPDYPTVGPIKMISGIAAESQNLKGYRGWDCSERNCPTGDATAYCPADTKFEIQRIMCHYQATSDIEFTFDFFGHTSGVISSNMSASEVKAALEYTSTIGNVTVYLPNAPNDRITSICSDYLDYDSGGLYVMFTTELGDVPLLASSDDDVLVYEEQKGTKVLLNILRTTLC